MRRQASKHYIPLLPHSQSALLVETRFVWLDELNYTNKTRHFSGQVSNNKPLLL